MRTVRIYNLTDTYLGVAGSVIPPQSSKNFKQTVLQLQYEDQISDFINTSKIRTDPDFLNLQALPERVDDVAQLAVTDSSPLLTKSGNTTVLVQRKPNTPFAGITFSDGTVVKITDPVEVDLSTSGDFGLDSGVLAHSRGYLLYGVKKTSGLTFVASASGVDVGPSVGDYLSSYVGAVVTNSSKNIRDFQQNGSTFEYLERDVLSSNIKKKRAELYLAGKIPSTASKVILSISAGSGTTLKVFVKDQKRSFEFASNGDQKAFAMPLGGYLSIEASKEGSGEAIIQTLGWVDGCLS